MMNFIQQSLLLILFIFIFTSCDMVISQVGELPEEIPVADNPRDPESPAFELPGIYLDDYQLDESFTVYDNTLWLTWSPSENMSDLQYRFRYAGPTEIIANAPYTEYFSDASVQIPNLEETFGTESYEYEIEISTPSHPSKTKTVNGNFKVDAFQNKGFVFRPHIIHKNEDETYTATIYIDEIEETDDLTAVAFVLNYNSSHLSVTPNDIRVYSDENSFLYRDGGEIISFVKVEGNQITIEAGAAGSNLQPLSGSGAFCEITFRLQNSFSNSYLSVSPSSVFKTSQGYDIDIPEHDEAVIIQ